MLPRPCAPAWGRCCARRTTFWVSNCKAILTQGAALTPLALPRLGAAHGGGAGEHGGTPMASASYLRGLPLPEWTAFVPAGAAALYAKAAAEGLLLDSAKFEVAVLTQLRMQPPEILRSCAVSVRGWRTALQHRYVQADGLDDLYTRLKTKRYPHARLRRLVLDAALQFPAELPMPPYLHVLGAKKIALPRLKCAALPAGTALAELVQTSPQAAEIGRLHSALWIFRHYAEKKFSRWGLRLLLSRW
ncbi:MAG: nucleotidyltransferase family protein [Oscillospiraceae bacterium]|nr:MAG: nucleotidyltransferase family protein [Oscillospiraceae bacterium]